MKLKRKHLSQSRFYSFKSEYKKMVKLSKQVICFKELKVCLALKKLKKEIEQLKILMHLLFL